MKIVMQNIHNIIINIMKVLLIYTRKLQIIIYKKVNSL